MLAPLRVAAGSFFRLECAHEQLFHSEYKRSNRTKGLKILRCFPHCCPEHIDRSYCGSSLSVRVQLAERPAGTAPHEPPPSEVLAVFARFEAVNDVSLRPGECVEVDKIQQGVQTESNLDGQWIAGVLDRPSGLVVTIRGSEAESDEEKPLVFHLNSKAFPRWYYDWESGANKAQRLMKHTLKAYVMERVAVDMDDNFTTISSREAFTQLYRVLHVVSSPEFTVISYRRAPLDQLQAAQAHAAAQLAKGQTLQQVKGEPLGLQVGGASPSTLRAMGMSNQMLQQSVYSPAHNASVMPIVGEHGVINTAWSGRVSSRRGDSYDDDDDAKRQRRIPSTRPSGQEMIHPLEDKLFWEHVNAPAVAVSKNMALVFAFVRWAPVRLYAPFVGELVDSIKLKMLTVTTSTSNAKKANKMDCFSRLLLQHARIEENLRAAGGAILPLELETLLRMASQTVLWLFSGETLGWVREFFCLNAALVLDKKAIRSCFIQFLHELEKRLNTEVVAASILRSLSNVAEQVIAAVYSHECFHSRRPLVRHILSGQSFAGWNMFVAQMRETYISTMSSASPSQSIERNATFKMTFPPRNAVERSWNGQWVLDMDDVQWDVNEVSSSPGRNINADPRVPDVSLFSLVELMSQVVRFELAIDIESRSVRVRAPQSLAGRLDCMHLVLDGKARVFRMFPNGISSYAGEGSQGDYFGEMRVEAPGQLVIFLEIFRWSLEVGTPSYHVRSCIEFHRNGRLAVRGDILVTTGPSTFTAEEIPYVGEMSLRAKRKSVEKAAARHSQPASGAPRNNSPVIPWGEYGRFRLCYSKV
ncbi:hypothetical protein AM588_10003021 [Phytophthora nicotianae]|uniref:Cyclic nucleotide-binding domain-containing protein n=1 Tax=Phytophthora nicotianae TaxID=4792 RepID=A0A0W8CY99_PHYNI|nr:hypothetical protein AM588_10003021 [Phytophthora nicotianae]